MGIGRPQTRSVLLYNKTQRRITNKGRLEVLLIGKSILRLCGGRGRGGGGGGIGVLMQTGEN